MKKTTNKKSVSKKLLPAVAMLTTSAIMLSTATYAWFTMSREVSVTGISMTATMPQTIEISLGKATAGNTVAAPAEATTPGTTDSLWSNTAATGSVYKQFGKLLPVSSVDGINMYSTTKAIDKGQAVEFTATDTGATVFSKATDAASWVFQTSGASSATKISDVGNFSDTDSEGYYIDIPVWFRTTSATDVSLGCTVKITGTTGESLYKAARVAILKSGKTAAETPAASVLSTTGAAYYDSTNQAVANALAASTTLVKCKAAAKAATQVVPNTAGAVTNATDATTVATVTKATTGYSDPSQYYVRIWLEGEDKSCWNANAGQTFNVDLNFYDKSNTGTAD